MSSSDLDPTKMAAFLDDRLSAQEREEMLQVLLQSDAEFEIFAAAALTRINPFRPASPISPGMFIGRRAEVSKLAATLAQTRSGNALNFMVTGERGMGKSSLLFYLKAVAEGRLFRRFNYLVIDTDVDKDTTQTSLLSKIALGLERSLADSDRARAFFNSLWSFALRVEAGGVRIHQEQDQLDDVEIERFAYSLAKTVDAITSPDHGIFRSKHDGVLLIIDEADNASAELRLGSFLKLLLERLARRNCDRFMVGVAGLPEVLQVMRSSHGSALRLFEIIRLGPLTELESAAVVEKGLTKGSEDNSQNITIQPAALRLLVEMSEGNPYFVQQLAYSAFGVDTDWIIDEEDVTEGAYGPQGALRMLGEKYGWAESFQRQQSDSRWAILEILASHDPAGVAFSDLRAIANAPLQDVENALRRLQQEGLVITSETNKEMVRLTSHSLRLWIRLQSTRPEE